MTENTPEDQEFRAKLRASLANERTNEAIAAEKANTPRRWTEAQEADLVNKVHGTTEQRIQRLIDEANNGTL